MATPFESIDLCNMAIELGAGFVARAFSGDKKQLVPLIKAAIAYRGFALLDVISPCVTFNNHEASTKSYAYVRDHNQAMDRVDMVATGQEITADYEPGTSTEVTLHHGAKLRLNKLAADYDPTDPTAALPVLERHRHTGEIATGLLYFDDREQDLHDLLGTVETPLNELPADKLCPGSNALAAINASKR